MEKALVKVGSIKAGSFWLTKKAKEEFNNISEDLTVSKRTPLMHSRLLLLIFFFKSFLAIGMGIICKALVFLGILLMFDFWSIWAVPT